MSGSGSCCGNRTPNFVFRRYPLPWFPFSFVSLSLDECEHIVVLCTYKSNNSDCFCLGGRGMYRLPPPPLLQHQHPPTCPNWHVSFSARARSPLNDRLLTFVWAPVIRFPVRSVQISCRHSAGALELRRRNQTSAESSNGEASASWGRKRRFTGHRFLQTWSFSDNKKHFWFY